MAGENQEKEHPVDSVGRDSTEPVREETASEEPGPADLDCVDESVTADHLEELPDGSGCVEVWEHLAERRGDER